jgi:hypothetical protein
MRKEKDEWKKEWVGMPEYVQEKRLPFSEIIVRFETEEDQNEFFSLIDQTRPAKLKSIWYPKKVKQLTVRKEYIDE